MRSDRLPSVYLLFVVLSGLQLALFKLSGAVAHVSGRGSLFMVVLLVALGFRSRLAWGLLVAVDAIPIVSLPLALVGSGNTLWGHVAVSLLTGVALEATLLSRAMRWFAAGRPVRLRAVPS